MNIQRLPNAGLAIPASLSARAQKQPNTPQDGFQPGPPAPHQGPSRLALAAKATAYGGVTALAVGMASHYSPFLGAAVGGVAGGLAGLALGLQAGEAIANAGPEHGPGTTAGYGGLMVALGSAIVGGAAGVVGGAALPLLASPVASGATLGAACLAGKYILDTH